MTKDLGSENVRRKFSLWWKRKFLIWRRAKYSTTYSPSNDLSRRKKCRNVLHEKWLHRVKGKKFEYWPDIPPKSLIINLCSRCDKSEKSAHWRKAKQSYSSKKSCYQCVLKMWAHLISLGSVWCSRCFSSSKEPDYLMTLGETKQRIKHSGVACFLFINYHSQSLIS